MFTQEEFAAQKVSALDYILAENAKRVAEALANGWGIFTMAPEAYAHCTTGYDVMLTNARAAYSDASKEAYGIRLPVPTNATPSELCDEVRRFMKHVDECPGWGGTEPWEPVKPEDEVPCDITPTGRVWSF